MYITHKDKVTNYAMLAAKHAVAPHLKIHARRHKAVMQYLIDLLTREFNWIRGLQLGLYAGRRSDALASSVDTDTSEPNAECCTAPHNKKLKLLEDMERDFDEPITQPMLTEM